MGIGITSNHRCCTAPASTANAVSIPNGDRHYLEPTTFANGEMISEEFQSPMGIGITSNRPTCTLQALPIRVSIPNGDRHYLELNESAAILLGSPFQSPMGIGITSNFILSLIDSLPRKFQSPMGIGITSNMLLGVSLFSALGVSIPNGDRHYLEPFPTPDIALSCYQFQSPMGIGITSNEFTFCLESFPDVFQSPMGIGITSNPAGWSTGRVPVGVSIPNGDRHYLEPCRHTNPD